MRKVADVTSLYPEAIRPAFVNRIREFYVNTYHDKFFEGPAPAWFTFFLLMEALYHGPVSIWAVGALLRGTLYVDTSVTYDVAK